MAPRRFLIGAVSLAIAFLFPTAALATFPGSNGKIAYVGVQGNTPPSNGVHAINPDGSGDALVAEGSTEGRFSPDGKQIAYFTLDGLTVANADGTAARVLGDQFAQELAWSPDGHKLLTAAPALNPQPNAALDLVTVDLTTGEIGTVQPNPVFARYDWSSTNRLVAADCCENVYTMNVNGSGLTKIYTNTDGYADDVVRASWSPDGMRVTFEAEVGSTSGPHHFDVFSVNSDGTGVHDLTAGLVPTRHDPIWSPDGKKIAYRSADGLGTMLADGTGGSVITSTIGRPTSWQAISSPKPNHKTAARLCRAERSVLGRKAFRKKYGRRALKHCIELKS